MVATCHQSMARITTENRRGRVVVYGELAVISRVVMFDVNEGVVSGRVLYVVLFL